VEMRKLGSHGPEISVVGFGAWEAGGGMWGENESDRAVIDAIHAGLDAGMNWIDTAEIYGRGRSEELVGRAVKGRREDLLVFTKVAPEPPGTGFRPEQVRRAIHGSLRRLGLDYVDLYQLHWPDESIPVEETWSAMAALQDEGLTRHVGVSNADWELVEACLAIRHVDSVQNELSLLHQHDRDGLLISLDGAGVGYLAYSPMALGLLTGSIRRDTQISDWRAAPGGAGPELFRPGALERNLDLVERLRGVAERIGMPLATLSLRWVIEQRGVTAAIAGSRNADHARSNALAGDLRLAAEVLAEIDRIFA
jgi:aryl-alcohol dehydrogenase-like predicted oxidoreductase